MGNLPLTTGLFTTGVPPPQPDGRFTSRPIGRGITYYQARHPSSPSSATPDPLPATLVQSQASSPRRPLLLFFSWLGAHPGAAVKYFEAYLTRGMDVLLVQSGAMHFLWPRWGSDYGLEVLEVLEGPEFAGRPLLVYASSIGGYTFTQVLVHVAHGHAKHAALPHRVVGHIYDSLVAGTLEHMATGERGPAGDQFRPGQDAGATPGACHQEHSNVVLLALQEQHGGCVPACPPGVRQLPGHGTGALLLQRGRLHV
ncbi:uncharacterized protein LOC133471872 isoform X2 [Phyllopteryx taeniolatus]|uniref:uncharacterized protein LOC133471872 isoform X2 n=1 Tax=Phyllopteryx taeniolatus TaxID=161469 RepID=UPI002AD28641|nr:uncharacterized protein LOC133471872 isoform X2 [Phyllopteryx taeniolatus]